MQYRVLCIDDNPILHKLLSVLLGPRTNVELLSATTAADGLEMARTRVPDLIFLDLSMPVMDGFEALSILKQDAATAAIPVVALSARCGVEDIRQGLAAGFADYITKPTDLSTLMRAMAKVLHLENPLD